MSILETIQKKVILKSKVKKHLQANQSKAFISINKAQTFGIIADFRSPASHAATVDFYKKLPKQSKTTKVILLINEKRPEINLYDYERMFLGAEVFVVCPEELSFFKLAKKSVTDRFTKQEFDILFRIDMKPNFSLDMIILSTRAKMYAGIQHPDLGFIDFSIELSQNAGYNGLTTNLIQYLDRLNPKQMKTVDPSDHSSKKLF